jgi:hypothetical protein
MQYAKESDVPYRRETQGLIWHFCLNCSGWPKLDFQQREDKPSTWGGQSLCDECDRREHCSSCLHSVELRTGRASDQVLGPVRY